MKKKLLILLLNICICTSLISSDGSLLIKKINYIGQD